MSRRQTAIEATDEEAAAFCVNAVNIGGRIIMAKAPASLRDKLAARGYRLQRGRPRALHPVRRRRLLHDPAPGPRQRRPTPRRAARRMSDAMNRHRAARSSAADLIALRGAATARRTTSRWTWC